MSRVFSAKSCQVFLSGKKPPFYIYFPLSYLQETCQCTHKPCVPVSENIPKSLRLKEYFQVHLYTLSFAFRSKNDAFVFCLKILFWKRQSFSTPSCASHNRQKKKKGLLERKVRSEKKRFHMSTQYTRKPVLKLSSHM
jgi:hypothetical protein